MKAAYHLPAFVFGALLFIVSMNPISARAQYDEVSLETFYEELSPYGIWIDDPQYGKVWRPDVDQDSFRPYYSSGHWEMTAYGNTWVSDYDWGWAPFHYGRWTHAGRRGWLWIPGTTWGPAWVSWRSGGGYYGWAPLGPGIHINISIGRIPDYYWVFIPQRSIYYRSYPRYDRRRNINIYHNTVIINNTHVYNRQKYYSGPRAEEIRRVTRQPVTIHDVRNSRPGRYAESRSERPEVIRTTPRQQATTQTARPERAYEGSRSTGPARTSNPSERQRTENNSRARSQNAPVTSQRSSRTYDHREAQPSQRQRPSVSQQRQSGSQRQTSTQRQASAPRQQSVERPSAREARTQSSSRQAPAAARQSGQRSTQSRPSRAQ